jgi:hypothetical protein
MCGAILPCLHGMDRVNLTVLYSSVRIIYAMTDAQISVFFGGRPTILYRPAIVRYPAVG